MRSIAQTFSLISILLCGVCGAARQGAGMAQGRTDTDPCGDPKVESSAWIPVEGKVVRVIDGGTIVISLNKREHLLVHLVGVAAPPLDRPFGRESRRFLARVVGGRRVEVWVSPRAWTFGRPRPQEVTGVVYLRGADMQDANLSLIRAGMARHERARPYTMSRYTECRYERAADEARAAHRGLWRGAAY